MSLTFNLVNNQIYAIVQPPPPTIISVVPSLPNILIVSWNILSNLLTYNLICSDNKLNVYGIKTNSYSVTVTPGVSYTFKVVSVINSGIIPVSSVPSVASNPKTYLSIPGAPAVSASGTSITINLTNSQVQGAISYNLYYSTNGGSSQFLTNTSSNTAPFTGTNGNSYTFTVVAVASDSTLSSSSSLSQSITVLSVPEAPAVSALEDSITIDLTNSKVQGAISYNLYYSINSGSSQFLTNTSSNTAPFTGTDGNSYTFTVVALASDSTLSLSSSPSQSITLRLAPTISLATSSTYYNATASTNGINYNVYVFTTPSNTDTTTTPPASLTSPTYTLTYNLNSSRLCYVLAVGGGSGGNVGGGGGGGVVMMPVLLPSGTTKITVLIGNGGSGGTSSIGTKGYNTYVYFDTASSKNIFAYGGGYGTYGSTDAASGGSGGGASQTRSTAANGNNNNNNFANKGGGFSSLINRAGGGGGAGQGLGTDANAPSGGNGIKCTLPGIKDYNPIPGTKSILSTYYWGGGGAGSQGGPGASSYGGNGGGGGGGTFSNGNLYTSTGGAGYNNGAASSNSGSSVSNGSGGAGGANTGGGGGGCWSPSTSNTGGAGGSGFVAISFPAVQRSFVITNYDFSSPIVNKDVTPSPNNTPTSWIVTGGTYYTLNGTGGVGINSCPYGQFFYTSTTSNVLLSQSVNLSAGSNTLLFSAAVLSSFNGSFTITVTGITPIYTSSLTNANIYWDTYSYDFNVPTAGAYTITFSFSCVVGITQMLIF